MEDCHLSQGQGGNRFWTRFDVEMEDMCYLSSINECNVLIWPRHDFTDVAWKNPLRTKKWTKPINRDFRRSSFTRVMRLRPGSCDCGPLRPYNLRTEDWRTHKLNTAIRSFSPRSPLIKFFTSLRAPFSTPCSKARSIPSIPWKGRGRKPSWCFWIVNEKEW